MLLSWWSVCLAFRRLWVPLSVLGYINQAWWYPAIIPAVRRWRQKDLQKFKVILSYSAMSN